MGAVVAGQTSVKDPEIKAFEKHLPSDVHIVSCHSLHGPGVNPKGQPLVRGGFCLARNFSLLVVVGVQPWSHQKTHK